MALDVLQRGFGNHVAVGILFFGITEQSERKPQIGEPPAIAARYRLGSIEGAVLPRAVGVRCAQHLFRPLQLLRALNRSDWRAAPASNRFQKVWFWAILRLGRAGMFHIRGWHSPRRVTHPSNSARNHSEIRRRDRLRASGGSP